MKIELVQQSLFLCPHICLVWPHFYLGGGNRICLVFWGRLIIWFAHLKKAAVVFQLIIKWSLSLPFVSGGELQNCGRCAAQTLPQTRFFDFQHVSHHPKCRVVAMEIYLTAPALVLSGGSKLGAWYKSQWREASQVLGIQTHRW